MKNILSILSICLAVVFTSCEDQDPFQTFSGTAVGLTVSSDEVQVPVDGTTKTYPVTVTTTSDQARTFGLAYTNGAPAGGGVSLGTITVPANSYEGTAAITFDFDAISLADGESETFGVVAQSDDSEVIATVLNITYFKAVICNDATVFIQGDRYGCETAFRIEDDMGNVVYSFGLGTLPCVGAADAPPTYSEDVTLPDGCYVAIITDDYLDGQVDGANPNGFFEITCSIATFASGGGAFGAEQRVNFCVNQ